MFLAIQKINSNEERAILDSLFRRYHGVLLKHALSICNEEHEAEDIVIDAMISLFDKAQLLDNLNDYECAAYLVHTVKRVAYKHNKTVWRRKVVSLNEDYTIASEETYISPELLIVIKERKHEIAMALMKLSERDQLLLDLYYYENFSYEMIAKLMDMSLPNVRLSIHRARRRALPLLKEVLENET